MLCSKPPIIIQLPGAWLKDPGGTTSGRSMAIPTAPKDGQYNGVGDLIDQSAKMINSETDSRLQKNHQEAKAGAT